MKKKKIVFSIAFVALALTFVLFGVFALKTKHLNTVGTVGFLMHDCEVSVYGEFQNVATSDSSDTLETVTFYSQENPFKITEGSLVFNENNLKDANGEPVSAVYYCKVDDEAYSITFLMSMQNNSLFDISVDLTYVSFGENTLIERTAVPAFIKQGETQTLNLTLTMIDPTLEGEENFDIQLSFAKADNVGDLEEPNVTKYSYQSFIYTLNEDSTANIVGYSKNANLKDLEIPQVINGHTVVSIGERAFYGNTVIETLVIPKTVTEIGVEAFSLCTNLTSVTFDDGTEVPVEGVSPFANTYSLENGNGLKIIRSGAFSYCTSLVNLIIPKNVEVIENGAFSSCQALEAFVVEEGNTYFTVEEGVLYTSDLARLICYPAGKTDETFRIPANIFDIDSSAFDNCLYLLKLIAKENEGVNPDEFESCLHSYVETIVEATCTEMGYTHYRCTRCGFEYSNKFVPAKGHHFYNHTCLICGVDEIFENIESNIEWYDASQSSFIITTKEQLAGFSYLVYSGNNFSGKTVLLGNDIDIECYEWVPIGNSTTAFAGTFDGQNYTISNLKINTNTGNVGLFGYVTGKIKNFKVTQANIIVDGEVSNVGIAAGYVNNVLSGISVSGNLTAPSGTNVGGVAGYVRVYGNSTHTNLSSSATVTGLTRVGGVIGNFYSEIYDAVATVNFDTFSNEGNVIAIGDYVGGIFGYCKVEDTRYNQHKIKAINLHNTGDIEGIYRVGGLFGYANADATGQISESSNKSKIIAEAYVGGLFGYNQYVHIKNCTNEGTTLTAKSFYLDGDNKYAYVGGYVGHGNGLCLNDLTNYAEINYTGEGESVGGIGGCISNYWSSTNLANIVLVTSNSTKYVGGIIGKSTTNGSNTYKNINNTANITGISYVGGIYGYFYAGVYDVNCAITMSGASNTGNIVGTSDNVGGIAGRLYLEDTRYDQFDLQATEIHNTGDITGTYLVGGLFGYSFSDAVGKISNSSNNSNIIAQAYVGGLYGYNHATYLNACTNEGTTITANGFYISGENSYAYIGGYIGNGHAIAVTDCTNYVEINYIGEAPYVGGIGGYVSSFRSSTNVANIVPISSKSLNYVGGIFGYAGTNGSNTYTNISNTADITGISQVGGLYGYFYAGVYDANCAITMSGASNSGDVFGTGDRIGGIAGKLYLEDTRYDQFDLQGTEIHNTGDIKGNYIVGGLFGSAFGDAAGKISNSSSSANITAVAYIGGLFGWNHRISLNACSNEGTTISQSGYYIENSKNNAFIGGYIGKAYDINLTDITNAVEITYEDEGIYVGGIVGYVEHITLTRVTNTANVTSLTNYVGGIIGYANPLRAVTDASNTGNITGSFGYVGGIAGYGTGMYNQTNVSNSGTITGTENYVAGLVGYAGIDSARTLTNLKNEANITGYNYVAGIYGYVNSGGASTLTDGASSGTITANAFAGGLFGHNIRISLVNCSNEGTSIVASGYFEEGTTTKYAYFGGYIGRAYDLSLTDITNAVEITYEDEGLYVGGVVGFAEYLQNIVRVTNTANVTSSTNYVGGIVGRCEHFRTVTDVSNTGNITGSLGYVGGIAGRATEMYNQTNVSNTGVITGTENYVGGLVGYAHINSARTLKIITNEANVTGNYYVAGIYGYVDSAGASTIQDSLSKGIITAKAYVGGLFGHNLRLSLNNCTNEGTTLVVSGHLVEGTTKYAYFGGYIGRSYDLSLTDITNAVEITYEDEGFYVGGIVGFAEYLQNVVRVTNTANISSKTDYAGGIVGRCEHFRTVTDVSNTGNITGSVGYVGGIAGRASEMYNQTNVSNTGVIIGTENYVGGLVGYATINGARTLTNLTNEANVTGKYYVGGLFGFADAGSLSTLLDSASQGTITAVAYIGGLFGHNSDINLTNCSNAETTIVTSGYYESGANKFAYVGGYVGYGNAFNLTDITNNIEIVYEYEGQYVGGIIGYATNLYTLTNVTNTANITANTSTNYVGGIAGYSTNSTAMTGVSNTGVITASLANNVGGIVGYATINGARTLTNVTNTANITGQYIVGGLFGYANASGASNLTESSSQGTITAIAYVGGLFGYNNNISLTGISNEGTTIVTSGYYLDGTNKQAFVGGYIGNANQINLTDITNNIEITYESEGNYVGGIIGYATNLYVLTNVSNSKNITAENSKYVGGVIGYATISGARTLTNITNKSDVTDIKIDIKGKNIVGGLFGHCHSASVSTITDSNSIANIIAEGYIGGLFGYAYGITLNTCSNEGTTLVANSFYLDGTNKYAYLGGYIGYGHAITVIDCTNTVELNYTGEGDCVGGIAGFISSTRNFTNVSNVANITSTSPNYVGGLVGNATTDGTYTLTNISNSASITANNYVGGLFGRYYAYVAANHAITITTANNSGTITATGNYVGGIAGYFVADESNNNRYEIYATEIHNTGDIEGNNIVGGLFGHLYSDISSSYLKDSTSISNIKANAYVGGLAGYNYAVHLNNCSNEGTTIEASGYYESGTAKYAYIGGYVGNGYAVAVTDCINYVEINYTGEGDCVGGIAGFISSTRNFTNVSNVANITSTSPNYVGGLVGNATTDGTYTLTNISNSASITANTYVGGLFGRYYAYVAANHAITITTANNSGTITAEGDYVGGIAGYFTADESGNNRYEIYATEIHNTGAIEGNNIVGGLFGHLYSDTASSYLKDSTSISNIKANAYVGGLAGHNYAVHLNNCSNEGTTIEASGYYESETAKYAYIGGYVGNGHAVAVTDSINYVEINYTGEGDCVGGIAGFISSTRNFTNVSNVANITSTSQNYVGGLVGNATTNGTYTFSNLENSASISGNNYTGGLFGRFFANINANHNFVITTVNNSGTITAEGNYVGGIAGYFAADESGENRYDIQATEIHNTGDIEGHCIVGGLFGHLSSDHSTASYIKNSTSSGKIKAFAYVGGLIGYNLQMHMTSCFNEGITIEISGYYLSGTNSYAYVGGLVGTADNLTITDCANYANIEYLLEYNYVGGIAGNIAGCRALTNVSNYGNITANLSSYVGGLIGNVTAAGDYTLTKLTNSGEIEGINYVGGLFGRYYANSSTNYGLKISEFNNSGKVIATGDYVGGLAGYFGAEQSGNDYYEIIATELFNTGDVEGQYIVGGLFGQFLTDHATAGSVTNTSNNANIKAIAYVGGLFGNNTKMNISGAVNGGTITVSGYYPSGENKYAYVGGIVGYATTINIVSCENKATINCSDEGNYVGGIVGYGTTIYNFNTNTNTGKITASKANYVGGIAGNVAINGARTLTTLINNGEIVGKDYVGGIGGYLTASTASTMITSSNTASITGEMRVGGLFGYNSLISLSDCTNDGDILSATAYVGGLIGQLSNITIDNSINNGNIEINKYYFDQTNKLAYVGGLVGYADKVTITDSSNNGAIDNKADGLYVGGVIGYANNLYTLTTITNAGSVASVSDYVGGILGYAVVSGARTFETLTNASAVSGKYYVGGIAGYITAGTESTIITSKNSSSVTANAIVGGLFGYVSGVNVNDCENTNSVISATNYYLDGVIKYAYLGGFVGYGNAISISDCENVAELIYQSEGARVGGIAGYISNSKALTNLTNSANITAITADCVGGIIGEINTNASVTYTNLNNTVAVSGLNSVGGIIGRVDCIDKNVTFTLTMTLFTNSGEITSTGNYVAGVVGYFNLSDANNKTPVLAGTELNNSGNVTGFNNVAGVFGFANAKGASSISSSENTGVITATILEGEQAEEAVFGDLVAQGTNVEFVA